MSDAPSASNLVWQARAVTRQDREQLLGQRGRIVWFTGLSGSGKSTIACALEAHLHALGRSTYVLDGDNIRHGLCADLGFSEADRIENVRRVGEAARLMVDAGIIVLVAMISPYRSERDAVRARVGPHDFVEVWVNTPLEVCEERDVKGLYRRARAGEIPAFTGISSPYEEPVYAEVVLDTVRNPLEACVAQITPWAVGVPNFSV